MSRNEEMFQEKASTNTLPFNKDDLNPPAGDYGNVMHQNSVGTSPFRAVSPPKYTTKSKTPFSGVVSTEKLKMASNPNSTEQKSE